MGEKAKPSVSTPGGFAVCGFGATLTRDLIFAAGAD
jgi:hypothetical protein